MNVKQRARLKLAKMLNLKFETIATNDKIELLYDGELEVGTEVFIYDENGDLTIPVDGEYQANDKIIVVEGGIITEIREVEVEEETVSDMEFEETETSTEIEDRIAILEEQVKGLVEIIKDITGVVDEVKEDVEAVEAEFSKAVGKSVKQPIKKSIVKQSKQSKDVSSRFFGSK